MSSCIVIVGMLSESRDYLQVLESLARGELAELPAGVIGNATLYLFPPLVDVEGPAVVILTEPDCVACTNTVTVMEASARGVPIHVIELDEAEALRLNVDTFPTVLVVDENGVSQSGRLIDEFTLQRAELLIITVCVQFKTLCDP